MPPGEESTFLDGPGIYLRQYPARPCLSFGYLPLVAGVFVQQVRDTPLVRPILMLGVIHLAAYSLLRVPPYHWYYAPEAALVILFGCVSLGIIWRNAPSSAWPMVAAKGLVAAGAPDADDRNAPIHGRQGLSGDGDADPFQPGFCRRSIREAGLWLKAHVGDQTVIQKGEIGTLAYYCECYLLDPFSDRTWIRDGRAQNGSRRRTGCGDLCRQLPVPAGRMQGLRTPSYTLTVREVRAEPGAADVMRWLTSSQWAAQSEIVLSQP